MRRARCCENTASIAARSARRRWHTQAQVDQRHAAPLPYFRHNRTQDVATAVRAAAASARRVDKRNRHLAIASLKPARLRAPVTDEWLGACTVVSHNIAPDIRESALRAALIIAMSAARTGHLVVAARVDAVTATAG